MYESGIERKIRIIPDKEEKRIMGGMLSVLDNAYGFDFKLVNEHIVEVQFVATNLHRIPKRLKELPYLQRLYFSNNLIDNIEIVAEFPHLTHLNLDDNPRIKDYTPLQTCSTILELSLKNNKISALPSLASVRNLRMLSLERNSLETIDFLQENAQLLQLRLKHNPIQALTPLKKLAKLEVLDLENTTRDQFPLFPELKRLKYLYLQNNQILQVEDLSTYPNLLYLDLRKNPLRSAPSIPPNARLKELKLPANLLKEKGLLQKGIESLKKYFSKK